MYEKERRREGEIDKRKREEREECDDVKGAFKNRLNSSRG